MRYCTITAILLMLTIGAECGLADHTLHLSFDRLQRTPVHIGLIADEAKAPGEILLSDSAKLARGVKGLGVYIDDKADYLCLPGGNLNAEAGSVSFWFRPMWEPDDKRRKVIFRAAFEKGELLLFSNALNLMIGDASGKQHYGSANSFADTSQWKAGQWHHAVLVWSAEKQVCRLFVDGAGRTPTRYAPAQGAAKTICFSPSPADLSGQTPACAVLDELTMYDHPLGEAEVSKLYQQGQKLLAGQAPGISLETSAYPNLAAGAKLTMSPKPNYGPPTYASTCNDPGDENQLSDGEKGVAYFSDPRSVGWMDSPRVVLDYDLSVLHRIGALGVNIGAGQCGPRFPKKVRFYLGSTPDTYRLVGEISAQEPNPNPEHPKWHAKTVGLNGLDRHARFVRIEVETIGGSLYLDEVMVVAQGAQPIFKSSGVAKAEQNLTRTSTGQAARNQPANTADSSAWTIKLVSPTPDFLHRGDTLRLKLTTKGSPTTAKVAYKSQMLERGDTIYENNGKSGWKSTEVNSQMRTIFDGRTSLPVIKDSKETVLELPLKDHPYGLFYLSLAVAGADGKPTKEETFRYQVLMDLPERRPNNLAGYDSFGWSYAWYNLDSPRNKPSAADRRMLRDYGFGWAHFRNSWEAMHSGPGNIKNDRLLILDKWVESALQQRAKIIFCLADAIPAVIGDDTELFKQMYREWVELFISRYADKVAVWEAWNEPDSKPYALKDDRDIFAIRTVHELRNRYCPNSAVITSTHTSGGLNYLERILKKGAGPYLDGIAVHPYRTLAPEIPEPDAYTGNPTGLRTFLTSIENTRKILETHKVEPPDVYVTEINYALNLQPEYDENDQANFMIQMNILNRTAGYSKCLIHHALHNGRLAAVSYPNMVRHMMDTTFQRRVDTSDDEVHAYLFHKSDGRVVLPIWSIEGDRLVRVSGLAARPEVTDIYGNSVSFEYDDGAKTADFMEISEAPAYLLASPGSRPVVSSTQRMRFTLPESVAPGQNADIDVHVKSPLGKRSRLMLQLPVEWSRALQSQEVEKSRSCRFALSVPRDVKPGMYPLVATLLDNDGRQLSMVGGELRVSRLTKKSTDKCEIVSEDFEGGGLANWQVQESAQAEVDVVAHGKANVVQMTQKGVDHPASLQRPTVPIQHGALEFRWKTSALGQTFIARLGELAIRFDGQGGCGVLASDGEMRKAGRYVAGSWHKLRIVFSAPKAQAQLWLDGKPLGNVHVPAPAAGYGNLQFLSGTESTEKPVSFRLDDIRLHRFNAD